MSSSGYHHPQVGATFYPGGQDDFTMPELISPSPQRIMPEVPSNMQEGLAHLELEAIERRGDRPASAMSAGSVVPTLQPNITPYLRNPQKSASPDSRLRGYTAAYGHTNASIYQNVFGADGQADQRKNYTNFRDDPFPSPFPKLRDPGPNVPPSDDEKEEILERARKMVLSTNDPEMQLAWAQDALLWVESAVQSRLRLSPGQSGRPSTPRIEHQLRTDAISIITFLADQFHPKALFLRASWYEFGKFGFPCDRKEAFKGYRQAAEKKYARAEYRLGTQYEGMHDMGKAIQHYSIGVSMGDSASSYRLGMMALIGQHGQQQDFRLGVERIQYAADTADENAPQGAYVYGMLLARELPNITVPESVLPIDIDQAKAFIEKAAYLGFAKAQTKMGQAYELASLGCEFNPGLSLHYNALAARQGEAEAEMAVSKWFLCGFEGLFEKNEELAFQYAQRAATGGLPTAEFALGYFFEIGIFVPMDLGEARKWYQKAADHGNADAIARLDGLQHDRFLSKEDHEQVALTRIKSQYGSKRGGRPERFTNRGPTLPAMSEEKFDMPDPRLPITASGPTIQVAGYPAGRPRSTAPYPEDDVVSDPRYSKPGNRSPRLQDGPSADRPNSAFGIRPLRLGQDAAHPSSGAGYQGGPEGRAINQNERYSTAPAGWEAQQSGYRQDGPPRPPAQDTGHPQPYVQDGRNRLQKAGPNPGNDHNYGRDSYRPPVRYDSAPNLSSQQMYNQRPDRVDLPPQNASRASIRAVPSSMLYPGGAPHPPRSSSAAPSSPSAPPVASAPAPRPIKEGPKTFEEMGIPAKSESSDCVVM